MQWITPVYEDYGVQRLRAYNRRPAIARAVDPVRAGEYSETPRQWIESRHQGERRRGGDRRRKQVPVILDTRSSQSRRALQNRLDPHGVDQAAGTTRQRINVYA